MDCEQGTRICGVKSREEKSIRGREYWSDNFERYNLQASDQTEYDAGHAGCGRHGAQDCEGRTSVDHDNTALNGLRFKCCPIREISELLYNSKVYTQYHSYKNQCT